MESFVQYQNEVMVLESGTGEWYMAIVESFVQAAPCTRATVSSAGFMARHILHNEFSDWFRAY